MIDFGINSKAKTLLRHDPCILLIGSEGEGLSKGLATRSDFEVNTTKLIGVRAVVDSLERQRCGWALVLCLLARGDGWPV